MSVIILAVCLVLLVGVAGFLVVVVVGVRRGDRGNLGLPACSRADALARRVVGLGVRSGKEGGR